MIDKGLRELYYGCLFGGENTAIMLSAKKVWSNRLWRWRARGMHWMTPELYLAALEAQWDCCRVCHRGNGKRDWNVDFDPTERIINGLLCDSCYGYIRVGCSWQKMQELIAEKGREVKRLTRLLKYMQHTLGPDNERSFEMTLERAKIFPSATVAEIVDGVMVFREVRKENT